MLYSWTIFVASFLLFQIQPLFGKWILPWFGGSTSVWTTCVFFYQAILLIGYFYAHTISTKFPPKKQFQFHAILILFSLVLMGVQLKFWQNPILPDQSWKPDGSGNPALQILRILVTGVGMPFLMLSATSPLIQKWVSMQSQKTPYGLYALSNAGSLLALISYPLFIEPIFSVKTQAFFWSTGFVLFGVLSIACGFRLYNREEVLQEQETSVNPIEPHKTLIWTALAACGSMMLLSTTNEICREVAVFPFLWVLPLTLYLLSFILSFAGERFYSRRVFLCIWIPILILTCVALTSGIYIGIIQQLLIYNLALFSSCMFCHGELYRLRPSKEHLTKFYICIAAGGAIGGIICGILAPLLLKGYWEFHLTLWLTSFMILIVLIKDQTSLVQRRIPVIRPLFFFGLAILGYALSRQVAMDLQGTIFRSRNFYGVLTVLREDPGVSTERFSLRHGRILHGSQFLDPKKQFLPVAYFGPESGVGQTIRILQTQGPVRIGSIGMGVGTLAAYGRIGDYIRFYEINPDVISLSQSPGEIFHYLNQCRSEVEVVTGDARISLERELRNGSNNFDLLSIDAFNSDSIPAHLLTVEAMDVYLQHLKKPGGLLAFHITNRYLDVWPVIFELAKNSGLGSTLLTSHPHDQANLFSSWVIVGSGPAFSELAKSASATIPERKVQLWTDDYYSILPILKTGK
jgi:hypothetical protein